MNVHVPEAGDQEALAAVDDASGGPCLCDFSVAADRDDHVALGRNRLVGDQPRAGDVDDRCVADQQVGLLLRGGGGGQGQQGEPREKDGYQLLHGVDSRLLNDAAQIRLRYIILQ